MAQPIATTSRRARFAELYARYGNGKKAALEAGYAPKYADKAGSRLLRDPKVQCLLRASVIDRDIHANETYKNLISVANASLVLLAEVIQNVLIEPREKALIIETAGRQLERLARCEGLMLPAEAGERNRGSNLQMIVQILNGKAVEPGRLPMKLIEVLPGPPVSPAPEPANGAGGNGGNSSNGHGTNGDWKSITEEGTNGA
jgi:hypothetical protein